MLGSDQPPGGTEMVAVLTMLPVAAAETVAVAVKVAVPPGRRETGALMSPVPLAGHDDPALAAHVQETFVSSAGKSSATVGLAAWGPAFEATIVYVTACPGKAVVWPLVLVIARSLTAAKVSTSVALLLL